MAEGSGKTVGGTVNLNGDVTDPANDKPLPAGAVITAALP